MTSDPGKGVGDVMGTVISAGSGVNVGDMGAGVIVGGTGVAAGTHPFTRSVSVTSVRKIDRIDLLIA